jgi:hypothetical protein
VRHRPSTASANEIEPGDESRTGAEPRNRSPDERESEHVVGQEDPVPDEGRRDRRECDGFRPPAVGAVSRGKLHGEVRDEKGRREEADRGEGDVVRDGERVRHGADVRDVPGEAAADRQPGCDPANVPTQERASSPGRRR